jgi:hypothetical protein
MTPDEFNNLSHQARRQWMDEHHPWKNSQITICDNCMCSLRGTTPWKYLKSCFTKTCKPFESHHQPAHHQPAHHQPAKECPLGGACPTRDCNEGSHPKDCRWGNKCTKEGCGFRHYGPVHCVFGGRCTKTDCHKKHPERCRFGDSNCTNPNCTYTHKVCRFDETCGAVGCSRWHPRRIANKQKKANP